MLQTTSVSFAEILVNSNRPTWSRIAQDWNLYQRRCRNPKSLVNSMFAEGQLHWRLTVYLEISPARYTRYSRTNRCSRLRFIPMSDFTAGPSSRKIQRQKFPCENNSIYICYYKTDHCYNFRTFSIDLYYCVTQMYPVKIQLSVKCTSLRYLKDFHSFILLR